MLEDEVLGLLMMEVPSLIGNLAMRLGNELAGLVSPVAAPFLAWEDLLPPFTRSP
jgi:hypothetical protein